MPKSTFKWLACVTVSTALLSGCGLLNKENEIEQIDPPKKVSYTDGGKKEVTMKEKQGQTIQRELYLVDKNGYVVPQTLALPIPKQSEVVKQTLEYLVKDGPVENILPNGFRAVLPADTTMTVDLKKDGTAVIDFSKEMQNYKKEEERQIVESVAWTLTQFKDIKQVKFQMNGEKLTKMPVGGTPLGESVSRADGINFDDEQITDVTNTKPVTLYFMAQNNKRQYYVPVTRRVAEEKENEVETIINELVKGPSHSSLLNDFNPGVKLVSEPKIQDGKVTLNFNENIYANKDKNMISNYVLQSLVLSLTEKQGVKNVSVEVNGKANLMNEEGEKLIKPVQRPQNVNTGSF
ncbi:MULTISPECIES: GerMN domain-containing protein [Bacillus cereus group]|uniref:Germination protein germ n=2 Tax=Bacillus cytotoxicus TaxID=580165 RepID=A0AAX2CKZ5_9BACI|nr:MULTISPECIES: GerMN domain-containing protein [Bacillus cereus group]ABS23425.1 germination protein GerM [Bacillus cytotoxicus NVH 391-98]AWC46049.1 sporulation protein [Bacillus cytotoxicus]MDH2864484.1 GerMN domain-containing protein [Bacillus cytotoxicus]MDH2883887.1 GerMN domain-containing protein [Bacillus cytotoxicus]MDH2888098.1 GerMN domain-containing protein [Bacillus cytotoxicus]